MPYGVTAGMTVALLTLATCPNGGSTLRACRWRVKVLFDVDRHDRARTTPSICVWSRGVSSDTTLIGRIYAAAKWSHRSSAMEASSAMCVQFRGFEPPVWSGN